MVTQRRKKAKKKEGSKRSIHRKFDVDRCYGSFVEWRWSSKRGGIMDAILSIWPLPCFWCFMDFRWTSFMLEYWREIYKSFRNSVARTRATQPGKIIWNDFLVDLLFSSVNLPMNYRTIVSTIVFSPRSLFVHDRVDKFIDFKFNLNLCETIFYR